MDTEPKELGINMTALEIEEFQKTNVLIIGSRRFLSQEYAAELCEKFAKQELENYRNKIKTIWKEKDKI